MRFYNLTPVPLVFQRKCRCTCRSRLEVNNDVQIKDVPVFALYRGPIWLTELPTADTVHRLQQYKYDILFFWRCGKPRCNIISDIYTKRRRRRLVWYLSRRRQGQWWIPFMTPNCPKLLWLGDPRPEVCRRHRRFLTLILSISFNTIRTNLETRITVRIYWRNIGSWPSAPLCLLID
jgi:hypothetical protein